MRILFVAYFRDKEQGKDSRIFPVKWKPAQSTLISTGKESKNQVNCSVS